MRRLLPVVSWMLADGSLRSLGREFVPLLAAIAARGSLAAAARERSLSYRGAWGLIEAAERATGARFVVLERGRGARLARAGERLVEADARMRDLLGSEMAALFVPAREPGRRLSASVRLRVAASHDMVLAALREGWRNRHGIEVGFHGSAEALALYAAGSVDVAGFHVGASDRSLLAALRPTRDVLLRFLRRSQGLILPRGNPKRVKTLADVARRNLRFVNRQPGSGTRILLDGLLQRGGLRPADVDGYANEEFTHAAVAATVAAGKADAGVGLEAAAREFRLAFVPLAEEDYLFVCRRRALRSPAIDVFRTLLAGGGTRDAVRRLAGYALDDPGAERGFGRRADGTIALLPA